MAEEEEEEGGRGGGREKSNNPNPVGWGKMEKCKNYSAGRKVLSGMYLNLTKVSPLDEIQKPQNLETEFDSGHFLGTAG